jgi:hypothetical protein
MQFIDQTFGKSVYAGTRMVQTLVDTSYIFLAETNENPKPFFWTADPDKIIAAVKRGSQVLYSFH